MRRRISYTIGGLLSLLLVAVVSSGCSSPQVSGGTTIDREEQAAFVWNGFDHEWTYNHRLNRMGDYLDGIACEDDEKNGLPRSVCSSELVHTGASGTGKDTLSFNSYYNKVVAKGVDFRSGAVDLYFDGPEQRNIRVEKRVEIPASAAMKDHENYLVLLNGYDLHVGEKGRAKKVKKLRIWVGNQATYYPERGTVAFRVGGVMNMNCDSFECQRQRNRVRYRMSVHFLVLGHDGEAHDTYKTFESAYRWTKKEEIHADEIPLNRQRQSIKGLAEDYDDAFVGFREVSFDLSKKGRYKDHWFVRWSHAIDDLDYDSGRGRADFDLTLFFKEWNAKTKKRVVSMARAGEATLQSELVLVQLKSAKVVPGQETGTLDWPGRNRAPDDDMAVWSEEIDLEF